MYKKLFGFFCLFFLTLLLVGCNSEKSTNDISNIENQNLEQVPVQPEFKMNIYGKIISMEGNEFMIQEVDTSKDPTFDMSPEDKKAYMAKLSEDERMSLKEEIRQATLGNVKILIPVGIPIVVKTAQGQDALSKLGSLEDLTVGSYISVRYNPDITDQNVAIYVKKSWTN